MLKTTTAVGDESSSPLSQLSGGKLPWTVLYLDHTAKMGGGEIALLNLVCALDVSRYRPVVVLAAEGPLVENLRAAGIETHVERLDGSVLETRKDALGLKSLLRLNQVWACAGYAFRLARLARRLKVDLIHTNSLKSDLYGGLVGRLAKIPVLWHIRDNIDGNYLPGPVAAAFRGLSRLIPQAVVVNSESTRRTLCPVSREARRRVHVIHDGYDPAGFAASFPLTLEKPSANCKRPIVALVGRIAEWKGQHVFIEAAATARSRFPQARFQIIGAPLFGEYDYESRLHQMVQDYHLEDQIEFLGFRSDVPVLLANVDMVVHASILGEPFGQVVIEGMAACKPVIATDGGALPEIVIPGETGLLVPMGDAPAMAEAMMTLLADPERATAMGSAGQQRVQRKFTIAHTAQKMQRVYDDLLALSPADKSRN